jgi:hypothetical protein
MMVMELLKSEGFDCIWLAGTFLGEYSAFVLRWVSVLKKDLRLVTHPGANHG